MDRASAKVLGGVALTLFGLILPPAGPWLIAAVVGCVVIGTGLVFGGLTEDGP